MKARYLWQFLTTVYINLGIILFPKNLISGLQIIKFWKKNFFQPFYMNNFDKPLSIM